MLRALWLRNFVTDSNGSVCYLSQVPTTHHRYATPWMEISCCFPSKDRLRMVRTQTTGSFIPLMV